MSAKTRADVSININLAKGKQYGLQQTRRGVRGALLEADSILVDVLSQPGQGETYKRGNVVHRASAPGDAPAPDTGRLRASRDTELFNTPTGAEGTLSVNAEYALPLEVGTERIEPRPFMAKVLARRERLFAAFKKFARD